MMVVVCEQNDIEMCCQQSIWFTASKMIGRIDVELVARLAPWSFF